MLTANSPVFKAMLQPPFQESQTNEIKISGNFDFNAINAAFQFIFPPFVTPQSIILIL